MGLDLKSLTPSVYWRSIAASDTPAKPVEIKLRSLDQEPQSDLDDIALMEYGKCVQAFFSERTAFRKYFTTLF